MTVDAKDVSNYDGEPVMLYEFSRKSKATMTGAEVVTYWRYTSSDRDWVDADANTWTACAISDDGVRQSGDTTADQLTITMPYNEHVPMMFVGSPPSDPIYAVIKHANVGETDLFLVWAGVVGVVSRSASKTGTGTTGSGTAEAQVICNTVGATMDRSGLRLCWSRGCPHDLYGFECKADPRSFSTVGTITALTGNTVTAYEFGAISALDTGSTGPIATAAIASSGSGYAAFDTGLIDRTGTPDAIYTVNAADGSGHVTDLSFTPGMGYATAGGVGTTRWGTQPGTGTGLTLNLTVTALSKPYTFAGGFLEWTDGDGHASRLGLIAHTDATVTVLGTTDRLNVGMVVTAFLGCDHTRPTCNGVFGNLVNHGGHDYMPDQNPFSGDLIF